MQPEPAEQDHSPSPPLATPTTGFILLFILCAFAALVALLSMIYGTRLNLTPAIIVVFSVAFLIALAICVFMAFMIVGTRAMFRRMIRASIKRVYVADGPALKDAVRKVLGRKGLTFRTLAQGWGLTSQYLPFEMFPVTDMLRLDEADVFIIVRPARDQGPDATEVLIGPADGRDADLVVHLDEEIQDAMMRG